jgi:hypothetical protein
VGCGREVLNWGDKKRGAKLAGLTETKGPIVPRLSTALYRFTKSRPIF